ncbi:hypothetical protein [Streptomyces sp. MST-110588]|uniref:hypothetical protein n=1 Tax=Streptomyces sp. MST-110588 TaxID=2833628 RepID=UPI001F5D8B22|nr:hypothetical protein [Streptomyces sp. MST-110588]UNO44429.1 hypothetical protein KGS77_19860 [Streptomyces sp. MST-110588]
MTQTPELPVPAAPTEGRQSGPAPTADPVPAAMASAPVRRRGPHGAWSVAAVIFLTIVGAAAFASLPGLLIDPLLQ